MTVNVITGDALEVLRGMPAESVHCVVTSPPYFGLRDYGVVGQIGLEESPAEYVSGLVCVFQQVRHVLRDDGTLWVNLGDSYANDGKWGGYTGGKHVAALHCSPIGRNKRYTGLKPKDLCMIPARVALALQEDGWYLRSDIIWSKPNPMPESVTDRPTKAHEYIFLLSKSERYYYDADAIAEPVSASMLAQLEQGYNGQARKDYEGAGVQDPSAVKSRILKSASWRKSNFDSGKTGEMMKTRGHRQRKPAGWDTGDGAHGTIHRDGRAQEVEYTDVSSLKRNKRTVWTVSTHPFPGAHFATFPPDLIEPCILAGCPVTGTVLDPFGGAGTTGLVADRLQRNAILIELNPEYAQMARERISGDCPMFTEVTA